MITTAYDTYTATRLVNQSMPIKHFMTKNGIIHFDLDDYVDEEREPVANIRHRDFPVLDENQNYVGMFSRRNLMKAEKKKLILVDHNEKSQAVSNIDEAEILEIIDHHRLGSLETMSPVYFRNQPLGCTSTIIYQMYLEKKITITSQMAGLMCAAILSDTLMFRSPTCTQIDREAALRLAEIAEVKVEELASAMFQAGSNFDNKTEEEILRGIREAKDLSEYDSLSDSAYLRAKEDYLIGINFSRLLSIIYGRNLASKINEERASISVGRVMTCVLGMIVAREREIRNFVKTKYYKIIRRIWR